MSQLSKYRARREERRPGGHAIRNGANALLLTAAVLVPASLAGQGNAANEAPGSTQTIDSLVALALEVNPEVLAAARRVDAARARVGPSGALPDPMLTLGLMNFPVTEPGFGDFMTMTTVGVGQRLPFPGRLGLARSVAESELRVTEARLQVARLEVEAEVRSAYYELAFLDRSLDVIARNQELLVTLLAVAESRYGAGTGSQPDVLKARVETARLAAQAVTVQEARRSMLAQLNALLVRPSEATLEQPRIPERIARAAVAESPMEIRFTSAGLGARAADSPLPPLEETQRRAIESSPALRAHEHEIAAQTARVELAGRAHLPDFDLSLLYGQRMGNPDMISVMVSVPVPLNRQGRQDQGVAEARAELASMAAGHHAMGNELQAEVARLYAQLERDRAQLALFVRAILPQGHAVLESSTAAFRAARADFIAVVESQAALYNYEIEYVRALADFASGLAELERVVGAEVLP